MVGVSAGYPHSRAAASSPGWGGALPRWPMAFYAMSLSPDGRLFVDESINDGTCWKGIDPRIYLTPEGKQVVGPLPTGQDVFFG